jgi:hypothetical protein
MLDKRTWLAPVPEANYIMIGSTTSIWMRELSGKQPFIALEGSFKD